MCESCGEKSVCVRAPEWATAPDGGGRGAAAASGQSTDLTQFVTIVMLFSDQIQTWNKGPCN